MANNTTLATRNGGINGFIEAMGPRLGAVATEHMTPERMLKLFAAATSATPKIAECTVDSLASSLLLASQLGLEPMSPLGHLYLVPYGKTCTPIIGYKGMLELIRRTGEVKRINAQVFYRQELETGAVDICKEPPSIRHQWTGEEYSDRDLAGAYCVVEGTDGQMYIETVTRKEIDARRQRSAASGSGPWKTDYPAMARKCAVRKLFGGGVVPISAEKMSLVSKAMEADGDSMAPRMTRAQQNMQSFVVPATGEVIQRPSEPGWYEQLFAMAKESGHSEWENILTAAIHDTGRGEINPELYGAEDLDAVMVRFEEMAGV